MKNIIAVTLAIMFPNMSLAGSLTDKQYNMIKHTLEVKLFENRCQKLKFGQSFTMVVVAGELFGISKEELNGQGRAASLHRKLVLEHKEIYAKDAAIYCLTGLMLYGPNGINVENMLATR